MSQSVNPTSAADAPSGWRQALRKAAMSSVLTSVLAVVVALVVGAILIAAANPQVQTSAGYLFGRPGDFFSAIGSIVGKSTTRIALYCSNGCSAR
jgi:simple sugar transport system permease protein